MGYTTTIGMHTYYFSNLKEVLAKASPERSGDHLACIAARTPEQRTAARMALADIPLKHFLNEALIPYETDEVTRLILDSHNKDAFAPISHLTVGDFRDWLLSSYADSATLSQIAPGITPEMAAAVSKLMRNQDLVLVAQKCRVVSAFRNTLGLPGRMAVRLQLTHPTDDPRGIAASLLDGLLYGCGDAVIGINPTNNSIDNLLIMVNLLDEMIQRYKIPTQSCVFTSIHNTLQLIQHNAPIDLVFQTITGTEKGNARLGINLDILTEAHQAALSLKRGSAGENVMYFGTAQGVPLSTHAHHGVDQQTCEARAYAVARKFEPLLVNTVVGLSGPEYLYDGKQIIRAGLEDHFCGKLLGLPIGCDVCTHYTKADSDDLDTLLTLLAVAGVTFIMGVPCPNEILAESNQSTSFYDAQYIRHVLGLKRVPEFEAWLENMNVIDTAGNLLDLSPQHPLLALLPVLEPAI